MTYTIWFCEILDKKENEINGLSYIKELYNNIQKEDLERYAKSICEDYGYIYDGIFDDRYVLFKDNNKYCLYLEEVI